MSTRGDPLDLIAEARKRQEMAERDAEHWKAKAAHARQRCKALIAMMRLQPVTPPEVDAKGEAHWERLMLIVDEFARVTADPYARYPDDDDEYTCLTHDRVKDMMAYRLQDMIKQAVAEAKGEAE